MSARLYLDFNATTPVDPVVSKRLAAQMVQFGNPSSLYQSGRDARELLESARYTLSECLGVSDDQLIFTSSGTEANNQVIYSVFYESLRRKQACHIILSCVEHSSLIEPCRSLEKVGLTFTLVKVNAQGLVDIEDIKQAIRPETRLISLQLANNEVGTIQPVQEMAEIARSAGILSHSDAVQALGKWPFTFKDLGVDFMSLSSHKVYAPKGSGALVFKDRSLLSPLLYGGMQERGLRSGTENVLFADAFATAVTRLDAAHFHQHYTQLMAQLLALLSQELPEIDPLRFQNVDQLGNTVVLHCPGQSGQAIAMNLDLAGIEVSTGSACSSGSVEPSHVLEAMGLSEIDNLSCIRVSFGNTTSKKDLHVFVEALKKTLYSLRL